MDSTQVNTSSRVNQFSSMDRLGPSTPNNGESPNDVSRVRDIPQQRVVVPTQSPEVVEETRYLNAVVTCRFVLFSCMILDTSDYDHNIPLFCLHDYTCACMYGFT